MKNPLRDEASAFQVVLVTLGGAILVALAAWIDTWLGLVVFLALVAAALWAIRGGMRQRPPQAHVVHDERADAPGSSSSRTRRSAAASCSSSSAARRRA